VFVKLEYFNPTGSYKDRMAHAMVEGAEVRGALRPGMRVIEFTGGSTGSSLAMVCAIKGYDFTPLSSDAFAREKIETMRAFGAEVELIPSPEGITPELIPAMIRRAGEITAQTIARHLLTFIISFARSFESWHTRDSALPDITLGFPRIDDGRARQARVSISMRVTARASASGRAACRARGGRPDRA